MTFAVAYDKILPMVITGGNGRGLMATRHLNEEIIVEKALEIIERTEEQGAFNMRKLARELGCAHTNIYNYFDSFDSLLWAVAANAMKRMSEYIFVDETLEGFMRRYLDFAFEHSGLYRLIWFYKVASRMPDHLREFFLYPSKKAVVLYKKAFGLDEGEEFEAIQCALAYSHGEIAMALNQRMAICDLSAWKERVLRNALIILNKDFFGGCV